MRQSLAALALIQRNQHGQRQWLAQWNSSWRRYSFVGGHKHPGESFRQCVIREIGEELQLAANSDVLVADEPLVRLRYVAWSESAQQDTDYTMELFDVQFANDQARRKVDADPRNRWLTRDEIITGRCRDGQPASTTMAQFLAQIGRLESIPTFPRGTAPMSRSTTDVAVTLIRNSKNEVLLVYSEKWGSFTLPMTKRRQPPPGDDASLLEAEDWLDAAARNVVECLGRPALPEAVLKTPLSESHFSKREQITKNYVFHVFEERFREGDSDADRVITKTPHVWAKPEQVLKRLIRPLSHTAHDLVAFDEIIKFLA